MVLDAVMGYVRVSLGGSFGTMRGREDPAPFAAEFAAIDLGHAWAIGEAIAYLAEMLPEAIELDHRLHGEGALPRSGGFGLWG